MKQIAADEKTRTDRINKCLNCEHLRKPIQQCKICGCFMKIKVILEAAKCPKGKW